MRRWRKGASPFYASRGHIKGNGRHALGGQDARREAGRPTRGRGLAHAGKRKEFLHALLRHARGAASGDAELDAGGADRCAEILGQKPVQACGREHLRALLNRASGGVVFTTIHKFMPEKGNPTSPRLRGTGVMPELSARQNIVVIADEAHRSQYGFGGKVNEKTRAI